MKKYEYIFKKLEHDINAGVYQAEDYLPTENELTNLPSKPRHHS